MVEREHRTLRVSLAPVADQRLIVEATGARVEWLSTNVAGERARSDDAFDDVVDVFVDGASASLFPGVDLARPASAFVLAREHSAGRQRWELKVDNMTPGALTVLVNLLLAPGFDSVDVQTSASASPPAQSFDPFALPALRPGLPFAFTREEPRRRGRDRIVSIVMSEAASDPVAERLLGALRDWNRVVLYGGYPRRGAAPGASGAMPDAPFQLDSHTFQQAFPDYFECDESCFHAVAEAALAIHLSGHRIESVLVDADP